MTFYMVKILDKATGQRVEIPYFEPWRHFVDGPFMFDDGRAFLFARGLGLPVDIALRHGDLTPRKRKRYVIQSVTTKNGRVVYSEVGR